MASNCKILTYRVQRLPLHIDESGLVQILQENLAKGDDVPAIRVFSLARSLDAPARSKVATVTIDPSPQALEDRSEWFFKTLYDGVKYHISIDLHFLDFTVLNEVSDEEHAFDCVAISGLASHPFGSWQQRDNEGNFMWLRDGLPYDLPGIRTITYGYDTHLSESKSFKSISDIATTLVNRLTAVGLGQVSSKPMIFIAHSLGGIVLKGALVILALTAGQDPSIIGKIRGLLLFGVPNSGMETAQLISMVQGDPTEELIMDLSPNSKYLSHNDSQFSILQNTRKFLVISFYETKTTKTVQKSPQGKWGRTGPDVIMVERESAIQKCSPRPQYAQPIDENHSDMVKFAVADRHYTSVLDCFRRLLGKSLPKQTPEWTPTAPATNDTKEVETEGHPDEAFLIDERRESSSGISSQPSTKEILESLWPGATDDRLNNIGPQYQSTFEWIFNDRSPEFASWLREGSGVYWIEGRPGAGKSTLMRFVYQHERTRNLLEQWSQSGVLLQAGFFFDRRGSTADRSFEGLLRALLRQILENVPELCRFLPTGTLPGSVHQSRSNLSNLQQAFTSIQKQPHKKLSMCLFIDGVDESDGDLEDISKFMTNVIKQEEGSATRCKICFSSRPRQMIRDAFGQHKNFMIQEHTKKDIRTYTEGRLAGSPDIVTPYGETVVKKARLVEVILDKANGVFLWVRLALDDTIKALSEHSLSSVKDFETFLEQIQPKLNDFYSSIVDQITLENRWEAYLILEMILHAKETLAFRDIHSSMVWSSCKTTTECCSKGRAPSSRAINLPVMRKLEDDCAGLIEVQEKSGRVKFMHETARAFINRPDFRQIMLGPDAPFPPQNGYTELAKLSLTKLQYYSGEANIMQDCIDYCFMAEATTEMPQYELIQEFKPPRSPQQFSFHDRLVWDTLCDSNISFAVVSNLLLYVRKWLSSSDALAAETKKCLFSQLSFTTQCMDGFTLGYPNHSWDYSAMSQLLLDHGVDTNIPSKERTPFHWLFIWEDSLTMNSESILSLKMAEFLLQHGQDPNCDLFEDRKRKVFWKPLHFSGIGMAQVLLKHNADINAKSSKGTTPLDCAIVKIGELKAESKFHISISAARTVKPLVDFLIANGGLISQTGHVYLPMCIHVLEHVGEDTQNLHGLPQASKEKGFLSNVDFSTVKLLRIRATSRQKISTWL